MAKLRIDTTEVMKQMEDLKSKAEQVEKTLRTISNTASKATIAIRDCIDAMNMLNECKIEINKKE